MPTGPKGEKRPADVIGNAVKVMRIATAEVIEEAREVSTASRARAKKGAAARATAFDKGERAPLWHGPTAISLSRHCPIHAGPPQRHDNGRSRWP